MRVLIAASLAGVALVSLVACSKPAGSGGGAASSAAAPTAPAPLTMQSIPHRGPGLWNQTMTLDGQTGGMPSMQLCVDEASEAKMSMLAQQSPNAKCAQPQLSRNLDGSISFTNSCDMGEGGKSSTSGTIRGDFNASYTVTMNTATSGASNPALNASHAMVITATRTGPCGPGQRGGDMILANGMKINALDRMAASPPPAGE